MDIRRSQLWVCRQRRAGKIQCAQPSPTRSKQMRRLHHTMLSCRRKPRKYLCPVARQCLPKQTKNDIVRNLLTYAGTTDQDEEITLDKLAVDLVKLQNLTSCFKISCCLALKGQRMYPRYHFEDTGYVPVTNFRYKLQMASKFLHVSISPQTNDYERLAGCQLADDYIQQ